MDFWAWVAISACPLTVVGLGVWCIRMLHAEIHPYDLAKIRAQQTEKLARAYGLPRLSSEPGERRKDIMRKQYVDLHRKGLTDEDLEWVALQMKLTGFDPTRKRYYVDNPTWSPNWPKDML